ncbi:armadillo-type protein [Gloeopeniophorella convolvens]|nr:armadillo-type protein [Gloeopeniophorella convolvens]
MDPEAHNSPVGSPQSGCDASRHDQESHKDVVTTGPSNARSNLHATVPSALATARYIEYIGSVPYPEGIQRPNAELSVHFQKGKFIYDRGFLLQFMTVCEERPDNLPPLETIGLPPLERIGIAPPVPKATAPNKRTRSKRGRSKLLINQEPLQELPTISEVASNPGRTVKALLNKLTTEHFNIISDQIIAWANKAEGERDVRTLVEVVKVIYEAATDGTIFPSCTPAFVARCRIKRTAVPKASVGHSQEAFERGRPAGKPNPPTDPSNVAVIGGPASVADRYTKERDDRKSRLDNEYARARAKRRALGVVRFMGEMFKLQLLTERIMHESIKKLLGTPEAPCKEEDLECLCALLLAVGRNLDTPKARAHLDVYFSRLKELTKSESDVIELRERSWAPRKVDIASTANAPLGRLTARASAQARNTLPTRQQSSSPRARWRSNPSRAAPAAVQSASNAAGSIFAPLNSADVASL